MKFVGVDMQPSVVQLKHGGLEHMKLRTGRLWTLIASRCKAFSSKHAHWTDAYRGREAMPLIGS